MCLVNEREIGLDPKKYKFIHKGDFKDGKPDVLFSV